jgi:hypothetical protein
VQLALWDTAYVFYLLSQRGFLNFTVCRGQEEYEVCFFFVDQPSLGPVILTALQQRLRPLSYSKSHVILIAYAIDTPDSLENVQSKVCPLDLLFVAFFFIEDGIVASGLKRFGRYAGLLFPSFSLDARQIFVRLQVHQTPTGSCHGSGPRRWHKRLARAPTRNVLHSRSRA